MKLIFHIFKKDVRHHWPEILVPLILLAVFAWDQPRRWAGHEAANRFLTTFLNAIPFLLILAWMFLIVRVVHGESLVGDRQFWTTRPYERTKLFAAKLLTAIVFLHLPLFIAQLILLKLSFFPVLASIPGLLVIHLLLFAFLVMYGFAIGSVTSGMGQAVLAVLVVIVGLIGIGSLFAVFPSIEFTSDFLSGELGLLLLAGGIVTALVQYIFRRTLFSRLLFLGMLASVAALMLLSMSPRIINYNLPAPTAEHPVPAKFSFDRTAAFGHEPGQKYYGKNVELEFPIVVEDLAQNTVVQIHGIKLDLDLPTAQHWTSGWRSAYDSVEAGRARTWPSVELPRAIFDPVRNGHVNARISLALKVYRVGGGTALSFDGDKLHFADGARCAIDATGRNVKCFAPLKGPASFAIYSDSPGSECFSPSEEKEEPWAPLPASYFNFTSESSVPDPALSPVYDFDFSFSRRHVYEDLKITVPVCPNTKFLFANLKYQYTTRTEIDLGDIKLANYLPTFPRKIVPPIKRPSLHEPSGTLSFNLLLPGSELIARR